MAGPEVALQTVTALARSALGKIATSRDSVACMTTATPTPMPAAVLTLAAVARLPG